jgi:hypothetical protein
MARLGVFLDNGQEGDQLPKVDPEFSHLGLWRRRSTAPDFLSSFRLENYMNAENVLPTTLPAKCDVLYDFRVFRHSPRSCKSL